MKPLAFHHHLYDQNRAAIREWQEASEDFLRRMVRVRNMGLVFTAISWSHFFFARGSWAWEATSFLTIALFLILLVFAMRLFLRWRIVRKMELFAIGRAREHMDLMEKDWAEWLRQNQEGEEWKQ